MNMRYDFPNPARGEINALFNAELRYLVETFESSETNNNQNFRARLD